MVSQNGYRTNCGIVETYGQTDHSRSRNSERIYHSRIRIELVNGSESAEHICIKTILFIIVEYAHDSTLVKTKHIIKLSEI